MRDLLFVAFGAAVALLFAHKPRRQPDISLNLRISNIKEQ